MTAIKPHRTFGTPFLQHGNYIAQAGFLCGGLLTASWDGTLRLWDTESRKCLRVYGGHKSRVSSFAILKDGKAFVSGSCDRTARVWDSDSATCRVEVEAGHYGIVTANSSGSWIACACRDAIRLYEAESGSPLRPLEGHQDTVETLLATSSGTLVSGSYDSTARFWDVESGKQTQRIGVGGNGVSALALSHDEMVLFTGDRDGRVLAWEARNGSKLGRVGRVESFVSDLCLSPSGRWLAACDEDGYLFVFDLTGQSPPYKKKLFEDRAETAVFSPDERALFVGGWSSELIAFEWPSMTPRAHDRDGAGGNHGAVLFVDDQRLVEGKGDGQVLVRDLDSGTRIALWQSGQAGDGGCAALAPSPNGQWVAGCFESKVKVWSSATGSEVFSTHIPSIHHMAVAFLDDSTLASGGYSKAFEIWNVQAHNRLHRDQRDGTVHAILRMKENALLVAKPDWKLGHVLRYARKDDQFACEAFASGEDLKDLKCLAMAEEKSELAGAGKFIKVWDIQTGHLKRSRTEGLHEVQAICFDPQGTRLVAGEQWGGLLVIDAGSLETIARIDTACGSVCGMSFSPNGALLAVACGNGQTLIWQVKELFSLKGEYELEQPSQAPLPSAPEPAMRVRIDRPVWSKPTAPAGRPTKAGETLVRGLDECDFFTAFPGETAEQLRAQIRCAKAPKKILEGFWFDPECIELNGAYTSLIHDFAEHSFGVFTPSNVEEEWKGRDPIVISLSLDFNGKSFKTSFNQSMDYTEEAFYLFMDSILEQSGLPLRWVDRRGRFLLSNPVAFKKARKRRLI